MVSEGVVLSIIILLISIIHSFDVIVGLLYDREWVLVDESRNYLNQKKVKSLDKLLLHTFYASDVVSSCVRSFLDYV